MARALLFRTIRYLAVKDERRVFFLLQLEEVVEILHDQFRVQSLLLGVLLKHQNLQI